MTYDEVDDDLWRIEHDNGDVTVLAILDTASEVLLVAADIDDELSELKTETLAVCATYDEALVRAERWMGANEKGLMGKNKSMGDLFGGDGGIFG